MPFRHRACLLVSKRGRCGGAGGGVVHTQGGGIGMSSPPSPLQTKQKGKQNGTVKKDVLDSTSASRTRVNTQELLTQHLARMYEKRAPGPHTASHLGPFPDALSGASSAEMLALGEDMRFHRRLSSRFTSPCDQEKLYGTSEVAFDILHHDVCVRLQWARETLHLLQNAMTQHTSCGSAVPRRLVVLVLYSHTQHDAAVGFHMKRIHNTVKAMLKERQDDVLGLLTAAVGVKWRDLSTADGKTVAAGEKRADGHLHLSQDDDVLWYPNAGLYTFNALIQCLCSVGLKAGITGVDSSQLQMHRKILIVSEGWFHVRTASELHQSQDSICIAPGGETVDVEPLPFVLGSAQSEKELQQFARYTACRALAP